MQDALLISGARLLDGRVVDISIVDGVIAGVEPHGAPGPERDAMDGAHRLVVPGYVNGHQHSHELLHRGRSEKIPLEEWMTSVRPVKALPLTERDVYFRTLAVAAEALRSGTTTICDDVGIDPVGRPEHLRAVVKAYQDAGIRAFVGPTLFDVPFARAVPFAGEELPPGAAAAFDKAAAAAPGRAALLAAFGAFAKELAGGRVQAIAAPSAPQRCSADLLREVRALADNVDVPVMMHLLETRVQAVGGSFSGEGGWVARLEWLGFIKPKTSLIHGVWLTAEDVNTIARSGASVQHNPLSNLKLGSGLADLRMLLDAGVNVSLGSDGCGSIETLSLHPNVAAAALLSTLRGEPESWLSAAEAFHAATVGGAVALGLEHEIARIQPGYRADLVLYRLDRPPFIPLNDPLRQLVFGDAGGAVASVIVDGRLVFHDGRLLTINEDRLHAELQDVHARLMPAIAEGERAAAALAPAMRTIRQRTARLPLPGVRAARFDPEQMP